MSPTVITVMVISAFFLGYISRWLQDTDTAAPLSEDYVSADCLKWVERQERSK
jgi:hypothetical protein